MATSTNKTVLFILLIIVIAVLFYAPFLYVLSLPFRVMIGTAAGRMPGLGGLPGVFFLWRFLGLLFPLIWILVAVWAYTDAERRGMNGILWGLLVFIGNVVGLIVYLLVRVGQAPEPGVQVALSCPNCGKPVRRDFKVCPYCQTPLVHECPNCGEPVQSGWKVCPYCESPLV